MKETFHFFFKEFKHKKKHVNSSSIQIYNGAFTINVIRLMKYHPVNNKIFYQAGNFTVKKILERHQLRFKSVMCMYRSNNLERILKML